MRDLLIVGVDPGATTAYAMLDIRGNLLDMESSKYLDLNTIIKKVTRHGEVLAVGCDKAKVPSFVEKFAVKTGGFVVKPDYDMQFREKKKFVARKQTGNNHEFDALASAVSAYKRIRSKLDKILLALERERKQQYTSEVIKLVFADTGLNIKTAIETAESKDI